MCCAEAKRYAMLTSMQAEYTTRDAAPMIGRSVRRTQQLADIHGLGVRIMGGRDGTNVIAILLSQDDIETLRDIVNPPAITQEAQD